VGLFGEWIPSKTIENNRREWRFGVEKEGTIKKKNYAGKKRGKEEVFYFNSGVRQARINLLTKRSLQREEIVRGIRGRTLKRPTFSSKCGSGKRQALGKKKMLVREGKNLNRKPAAKEV